MNDSAICDNCGHEYHPFRCCSAEMIGGLCTCDLPKVRKFAGGAKSPLEERLAYECAMRGDA